MVYKAFCFLRECGILIKNSVDSFSYQTNYYSESLEVKTARMTGSLENIAFFNVRRQAVVKTQIHSFNV